MIPILSLLLHQVEEGLLPHRPVVKHAGELLHEVQEEAAERSLQGEDLERKVAGF